MFGMGSSDNRGFEGLLGSDVMGFRIDPRRVLDVRLPATKLAEMADVHRNTMSEALKKMAVYHPDGIKGLSPSVSHPIDSLYGLLYGTDLNLSTVEPKFRNSEASFIFERGMFDSAAVSNWFYSTYSAIESSEDATLNSLVSDVNSVRSDKPLYIQESLIKEDKWVEIINLLHPNVVLFSDVNEMFEYAAEATKRETLEQLKALKATDRSPSPDSN